MEGIYEADVEKVQGSAVWVRVRLAKGTAGPYRCRFLEGPGATSITTPTGPASGGTAHTHAITRSVPAALAKGDRVVVAFLAGDADRPLVLGRPTS